LLAPEAGRPADPRLPRLADPELRSRLVGYLGRGWIIRSTYRTDGVWVWPESLAERMRVDGVGPSQAMLDHILSRDALVPARVAAENMAAAGEAIDECALAGPDPHGSVSYRATTAAGASAPTDLVRLTPPATVGTAVAGGSWLSPTGWWADQAPAGVSSQSLPTTELSEPAAADLADRLCQQWHDELRTLGREAPPGHGLRPARVYDTVGPDGRPAFSPARLRIVEIERRDRMIRYLNEGRMVLRAAGRAPDPTTGDPEPRVPLSFRTDGVWVWSDAVAYYLAHRGAGQRRRRPGGGPRRPTSADAESAAVGGILHRPRRESVPAQVVAHRGRQLGRAVRPGSALASLPGRLEPGRADRDRRGAGRWRGRRAVGRDHERPDPELRTRAPR